MCKLCVRVASMCLRWRVCGCVDSFVVVFSVLLFVVWFGVVLFRCGHCCCLGYVM